MDGVVLSVNGISVDYPDGPVLRDVSLKTEKGQIVGIVGESGSGKSTLLYSIMGLLGKGGRLTGGSIEYNGRDLGLHDEKDMRAIRGSEISMIAQEPVLSFHPLRRIDSQLKDMIKSHPGLTYTQAKERMKELLLRMNIKDSAKILSSYPFELSGGMCQRTSIAMAMLMEPELLLADEPTSALDVTVQKQVADELMSLRQDYQTSMIIVSHNMGVITYMADVIYVMYAGMVVEYGPVSEIIERPLHPYTINLIRSVPRLNGEIPENIKSMHPDRMKQTCPIAQWCESMTDECCDKIPGFSYVGNGHYVRCPYMI